MHLLSSRGARCSPPGQALAELVRGQRLPVTPRLARGARASRTAAPRPMAMRPRAGAPQEVVEHRRRPETPGRWPPYRQGAGAAQEFVELVRAEQLLDALRYARARLAPWAGAHLPELQRALAALAFRAGTACEPYAALFAPGAWGRLADLFRCEVYRLHSLPPESQLVVHLQARARPRPPTFSLCLGASGPASCACVPQRASGQAAGRGRPAGQVCWEPQGLHSPPRAARLAARRLAQSRAHVFEPSVMQPGAWSLQVLYPARPSCTRRRAATGVALVAGMGSVSLQGSCRPPRQQHTSALCKRGWMRRPLVAFACGHVWVTSRVGLAGRPVGAEDSAELPGRLQPGGPAAPEGARRALRLGRPRMWCMHPRLCPSSAWGPWVQAVQDRMPVWRCLCLGARASAARVCQVPVRHCLQAPGEASVDRAHISAGRSGGGRAPNLCFCWRAGVPGPGAGSAMVQARAQ